jgi:uncharacterized protein (DUF433 family)
MTAKTDPRFDLGLYAPLEAARLARVSPSTLRNWIEGYRYRAHGKVLRARPVIHPRAGELSFVNLAEAVALSGFREAGVSMQRVRKALEYAGRLMKTEHPLASERILTDGADLFWEYEEKAKDGVHLVNMTRHGQKVFPETVMRYLREMEWASDRFVTRWWPGSDRPKNGLVVIDPRRAFGAPVIAGTGIRTEDLFHRFRAGESIEQLTEDYRLTHEQVQAAIRLEARLLEPIAA